jgi:hypothetical protein
VHDPPHGVAEQQGRPGDRVRAADPGDAATHPDPPLGERVVAVAEPRGGHRVGDERDALGPRRAQNQAGDERIDVVPVSHQLDAHALVAEQRAYRPRYPSCEGRHRVEQVGRDPGAGIDGARDHAGIRVGMPHGDDEPVGEPFDEPDRARQFRRNRQ